MKTTTTPVPFISDRAARSAFTRAEKAWRSKQSEGWQARDTYRAILNEHSSIDSVQYEALRAMEARCEAEASELFEAMRSVYERAMAQGIGWINSSANWHFGHNATRDLIAANVD